MNIPVIIIVALAGFLAGYLSRRCDLEKDVPQGGGGTTTPATGPGNEQQTT